MLEKYNMSLEDFSKLLNPNKTLTEDEFKIVSKIRAEIGIPNNGTQLYKW